MRELTVGAADAGRRLDRFIQKAAPGLTAGLCRKYFRQKDIKLNGRPARAEDLLKAGDVVRAYLPEALFEPVNRPDPLLSRFRWSLEILYEDDQLLVLDKRPGVLVHPDDREKLNTLVTHVRAYLYQKGQWDPSRGFAPAPANRIDRFTGGIVVFAKTQPALEALTGAIRRGEADKRYLCVTLGAPKPPSGTLTGYILKNTRRVTVLDAPRDGAQKAVTRYRTLAVKGGLALIECTLLTGRTHQIRAQLAHAGHPLLGDGQYGDRARNEGYGLSQQALYAWKLTLNIPGDAGALAAVSGRTFRVKRVPFVERYFPEVEVGE